MARTLDIRPRTMAERLKAPRVIVPHPESTAYLMRQRPVSHSEARAIRARCSA